MENRLKSGDYILINKLFYSGPFSKLFQDRGSNKQLIANDIFVFRISSSDKKLYVKRCVGLPGQKIEIKNSRVIIAGKYIEEPNTVRRLYSLWYTNYDLLQSSMEKNNIDLFQNLRHRYPRYAVVYLDNIQKRTLEGKDGVDSIVLFNSSKSLGGLSHSDALLYGSEIQDFAKVLIPYAGMTLNLDSFSYARYQSLLTEYEGVKIECKDGRFSVNGKISSSYKFKHDYYFMMGDNRNNSIDSRYFGLIPRYNLIGKVLFSF